jgi:ubiquinone/menaquinone biosynthesis C-methylase UbiE
MDKSSRRPSLSFEAVGSESYARGMTARASAPGEVEAAQAVYTPVVLAVYDWFVLGFSSRFAWRCSRTEMLAFYDRHVGPRHLDIGVGTGFFLDKCEWPVARPELTLLDMNPHSLRAAARRTERFRPRLVQANVLEPLDLGEAQFDSIGMNFLLHCLPGPVEQKATTAARNLKRHLQPNGILFGSTILGRGVRHSVLGRSLLHLYNKKGIFSNRDDDLEGLEGALAGVFSDVAVDLKGTVALFSAR